MYEEAIRRQIRIERKKEKKRWNDGADRAIRKE